MSKSKQSMKKYFIVTVLSLGFMVLGIGSITWAMVSIWEQSQSDYYDPSVHPTMTVNIEKTINEKEGLHITLPTPMKPIYTVYPAKGDDIGSLIIPALNRKLPIIQGTDTFELKKGVGHFIQSVLPGEKSNCVLSGHRETTFREIGNLKIGDKLIVQTSAGTFTYEVDGTRIVHADDRTVIVPTKDAVLTMTTCYPFDTPGYFPDRYIVSAVLVKSN